MIHFVCVQEVASAKQQMESAMQRVRQLMLCVTYTDMGMRVVHACMVWLHVSGHLELVDGFSGWSLE